MFHRLELESTASLPLHLWSSPVYFALPLRPRYLLSRWSTCVMPVDLLPGVNGPRQDLVFSGELQGLPVCPPSRMQGRLGTASSFFLFFKYLTAVLEISPASSVLHRRRLLFCPSKPFDLADLQSHSKSLQHSLLLY